MRRTFKPAVNGHAKAARPVPLNVMHTRQESKETGKMEYRELGRTGWKVSTIGLGHLGDGQPVGGRGQP